MIELIVICLFVMAAVILTYFIIKRPTVVVKPSTDRLENKILDLDFYIKKGLEGENLLFLKIRNLSNSPIFNIEGSLKYYSRNIDDIFDFFKVPTLSPDESREVFLTTLESFVKYYVDVKVAFQYSENYHHIRFTQEFMPV